MIALKYVISFRKHLSKKRQFQYLTILIITIIGAFFETLAVTSSVPFISYLTNNENINNIKILEIFQNIFNIEDQKYDFIIISLFFGINIIFASIIRLLILFSNIKFSELIGLDIGKQIFSKSLNRSYLEHTKSSSSEIIDGISIKLNEAIAGINAFLQLLSWLFIFLGLIISLMIINYKIALTSSFIFIITYLFISLFSNKTVINNSKIIATKSEELIEIIQDSFGGIRDIIIGGYHNEYIKKYRKIESLRRSKLAETNFITLSPKFILEAIGYTLIILITLFLHIKYSDYRILSTLGGFAIGAQRLLPALQQIYANISKVKSYQASFKRVLRLLNQSESNRLNDKLKLKSIPKLEFKKSIKLKNICFKYSPEENYVLNSLDLTIKKGDCIGIKGKTGEGKSTLLDILMGLLEPKSGKFMIDDIDLYEKNKYFVEQWLNKISHVPQSIFLTNSTIARNIAFGIDSKSINYKKLYEIAEICQLKELIDNLQYGFETLVGERGIMLSGGQRQRIGIARALYFDNEVIFLDEATSALDNFTEKKIMDSIYELSNKITIVIIAHRLSTLQSCNKIYELKENKLQLL